MVSLAIKRVDLNLDWELDELGQRSDPIKSVFHETHMGEAKI